MKQDSTAWKFRTQKSNGNIYPDFEDKIGAFPRDHFIHMVYCFEAWEVKSLILQTMCKWELK